MRSYLLILILAVSCVSQASTGMCFDIFKRAVMKHVFHRELDYAVSLEGTVDNGELAHGMLPRGSALLTSSGALEAQGIRHIIHAATGSMTKQGDIFEPTLNSIENSVANSIKLAEKSGHQRIAIPLLGGGIFLQRLGVEPSELARRIILAAQSSRTRIQLRFVAFAEADVQTFQQGLALAQTEARGNWNEVEVVQGSLTNFGDHGATAIVNAANTEVVFGGGLSGLIGRATQNEKAINSEASEVIQRLGDKQ